MQYREIGITLKGCAVVKLFVDRACDLDEGGIALTGLGEWATYTFSPLGLWGTGASTQVDNLALLQLASVAGVAGIGLVMAVAGTDVVLTAECSGHTLTGPVLDVTVKQLVPHRGVLLARWQAG